MAEQVLKLQELDASQVPQRLKADYYFDFKAHPFAHAALFGGKNARSVIDAIAGLNKYLQGALQTIVAQVKGTKKTQADFPGRSVGKFTVLLEDGAVFEPGFIVGGKDETATLSIAQGAAVLGANIWLDSGSIAVGPGTVIEPGAGIKGPTIIGRKNEIRQGAYFRGDILTGDGCTLRGELKNTVVMDQGNFPHPSYLGDSLCGYGTHFGNQATSANLGIFAVIARDPIVLAVDGQQYDLGRPKVGIIMGDYSQVGCNSVSDPGTFLAPWTVVYQLSRLNKGFYGPYELIKNKPMERGVIERSPLKK
ncbi:MAG: hypothetical protein FJ279_26000 [Planctomycetes bacterium]|nr:hypothetical protein [Planctomycetota bacterium]